MARVMKKTQRSNNDRISELPEHIIHHIFSFLPPKDATKTTALSRVWRDVWLNVPNLNLGRYLLCPRPHPRHKKVPLKLRKEFFNFVDKSLTKRATQSINLNTISVSLYVPDLSLQYDLPIYLERWINLVLHDLRVDELILENDYFKKPSLKFVFKHSIIALPLKRLDLSRVTISTDTMRRLSTNFPSMEKLRLFNCNTVLRKFTVSGFPKLTEFVFKCDGNYRSNLELVIDVPNLGFLDYKSPGDFSTVRMDTCRDSLRDLRLSRVSLSSGCYFSFLSDLELNGCKFGEKDVVISSKNLKTLSLYNCIYSPHFRVTIKAMNLKYFNFSGLFPNFFDLTFLELEKAYFRWHNEVMDDWHLSFICKINPCKTLELAKSYYPEQMIVEQEELSSENLHRSLPDVKYMKLMFLNSIWCWSWHDPEFTIGKFMDTLLWICPCLSTITIALYRQKDGNEIEHKVIKLKYYHEYGELRSWKHRLAKVTIQNNRTDHGNEVTYRRRSKKRTMENDDIKSFFENARQNDKITVNIIN